MSKIKRALISVFDKQGIVEFAKSLEKKNVEIISTGGTARLLKENGINCIKVSDVTGAQEMLDGRVKTLHPYIHGAILAKRENSDHIKQLDKLGITPIDLVVINLYPFEEVTSKPDVDLGVALENIDIGGPTMIRAAAKNFTSVSIVTSKDQYGAIINELFENDGELSLDTRKKLAASAFNLTHKYDSAITKYLQNIDQTQEFPDTFSLNLVKKQNLRYGENPHQAAALYQEADKKNSGITEIEQLHGKELSFNNFIDLDAVVKLINVFNEPCSVIVKHTNPCGVAVGKDISTAFDKAFTTDTSSAFGGIFGFNRSLDLEIAEKLRKIFIEVIIAPDFDQDALSLLSKKKNVRLLKVNLGKKQTKRLDFKKISGGLLIQNEDIKGVDDIEFKVVSKRQPTQDEWKAMKFAWKVVKSVKSNAVIYCLADRTIGIGAGQMARVDSSILAVDKAGRANLSLSGTAVASDAFFPFRDGVDAAANAGATAIIQPGGSVRDEEVVQAANEKGLAMVFTGVRHFRH